MNYEEMAMNHYADRDRDLKPINHKPAESVIIETNNDGMYFKNFAAAKLHAKAIGGVIRRDSKNGWRVQ